MKPEDLLLTMMLMMEDHNISFEKAWSGFIVLPLSDKLFLVNCNNFKIVTRNQFNLPSSYLDYKLSNFFPF